jgi:hypothetical protein
MPPPKRCVDARCSEVGTRHVHECRIPCIMAGCANDKLFDFDFCLQCAREHKLIVLLAAQEVCSNCTSSLFARKPCRHALCLAKREAARGRGLMFVWY